MYNTCVIKNIDSETHTILGVELNQNDTYTIPDTKRVNASNNDDLLNGISSGIYQIGDGTSYFTTTSDQISYLKSVVSNVVVDMQPPFAAKQINGKKLFKRVHGVSVSCPDGQTTNIDLVIPYTQCKFSGAEIFNTDFGDTVDFKVLDDSNNTYSGAPGSNYQLNQFGFDVVMPSERYKNTSNYDADLYSGMILRCEYTNNSGSTKTVAMNAWLHELKD